MTDQTKRDYVFERLRHPSQSQIWPIEVAYGLNSFDIFRGLNTFLRKTGEVVLDLLPFNLGGQTNYVSETLKLTRYLSYNNETL